MAPISNIAKSSPRSTEDTGLGRPNPPLLGGGGGERVEGKGNVRGSIASHPSRPAVLPLVLDGSPVLSRMLAHGVLVRLGL